MIENVGNIIFWVVVGFFGFWVLSKFFMNIKTLERARRRDKMARNQENLSVGIVLAISFLVCCSLYFHRFLVAKNGLVFADDLFNKLSKGSSYFIPKVAKDNEKFMGKMFTVSIKVNKPEDKPGDAEKRAERAAKLFTLIRAPRQRSRDLN